MNIRADIEPALRLTEVCKSFGGQPAVRNVSFDVQRGDILGFLGPNGAGKTTVMSMVAGLLAPDSGGIDLLGVRNGARDKQVRSRIGFLQEKPRIYPDQTARAYLSFFANLYGVTDVSRRVEALLDLVALSGAADRPMGRYSRGMQQRVCLARVLLHEPEFLMLDEPTLGLDPNGVAQMREIFARLNAQGVTLLFSSHQLAEMERICDRVVLMERGRVVAAGPKNDLLAGMADSGTFSVELFAPHGIDVQAVAALPGIARAQSARDGTLMVSLADHDGLSITEQRARIATCLTDAGHSVLAVSKGILSLEDVFLRLTAAQNQDEKQEMPRTKWI